MGMRKIPSDTEYFKYVNMNPKNRATGDCVIRALAYALDRNWDDVLDELVVLAHRYKTVPNDPYCYKKYLEDNGYVKMAQPRKDDNRKYTGKEFIGWMKRNEIHGKVLAHIGADHITVFDTTDYRCADIWDCTNGAIGNYWIR